MQKRYLLAFDFDKTLAETYKIREGFIDSTKAYDEAVSEIFGEEGRRVYHEMGGLNNRSPSELVHDLLKQGDRKTLVENALTFFTENIGKLEGTVPRGKGVPLVWNEENPDHLLGELLVRQKLAKLLPQTRKHDDGSVWPEPMDGFLSFWEKAQELKRQGAPIDLAVISANHDLAVEGAFFHWGLKQPDIMVTEDDIRGMEYPKQMELRVKPGPLSLGLAYHEWRQMQGVSDPSIVDAPLTHADQIMYFGDDPVRDGEMARKQGIMFGFFDYDNLGSPATSDNVYRFTDWLEMENILVNNVSKLQEGRPIREMFKPVTIGKETKQRNSGSPER